MLRHLDLLPLPGTPGPHLWYVPPPPSPNAPSRDQKNPLTLSSRRGDHTGELDVLFANRVSARKFAQTEADQFAGHGGTVVEKTE